MQHLVLKNLDAVFYANLSALAQQQGQDLESYIVSLLQEALTKQQQETASLAKSYQEMAADSAREQEAFAWIENTLE